MLDRLFVLLQFLLPRHLSTALVWRIARIRTPAVKDALIRGFIRVFDVDLEEVRGEVPGGFATFNDFFVRELRDGAREIEGNADVVVSPVDGTVSAAGTIDGTTIFQAKGVGYSLADLLATDLDQVEHYVDGRFATIYLAPYNYHRVHAALAGELVAARYVPGDLFSVNAATVQRLDGLFRRNERLVMHFRTADGPAALVLVGALNVGSISTPWSGEIRPRKAGVVDVLDISAHPARVEKGDLLGWFNMGSTVILLLPRDGCDWDDDLEPGETLRMGEEIGTRPGARSQGSQ
ncbi:MAG: phosphatidylserine decarboxylase [Gammaproteobacteria bacterium]|nr:phosphatidylserine decarboxylase [Gammaproteobacteria bacterium]NNL62923.1 phosphatidylserine decarboxylase [Woeseiaceae bacterium]